MPLCVIISDAHYVCVQSSEGRSIYTNDYHKVGVLVLTVLVKCSEITRDEVINCALEIQYLHKKLRFEHYRLHPREGE